MKTTTTYNTLAQALKAIATLGNSFATIANCNLIKADNEVDCNVIRKDLELFKSNGMLNKKKPFFSDSHPYIYFMGIREHGQEGGADEAHVTERMKHFAGALAAVKLTYNGQEFTLSVKTA